MADDKFSREEYARRRHEETPEERAAKEGMTFNRRKYFESRDYKRSRDVKKDIRQEEQDRHKRYLAAIKADRDVKSDERAEKSDLRAQQRAKREYAEGERAVYRQGALESDRYRERRGRVEGAVSGFMSVQRGFRYRLKRLHNAYSKIDSSSFRFNADKHFGGFGSKSFNIKVPNVKVDNFYMKKGGLDNLFTDSISGKVNKRKSNVRRKRFNNKKYKFKRR